MAAETGRTKSFYAREAFIEDLYLAESRLADLRSGATQSISLEDVITKHGLADEIRSVGGLV
jgi:RHH-type rel operon transcriptional repressor/antitoxin RelB